MKRFAALLIALSAVEACSLWFLPGGGAAATNQVAAFAGRGALPPPHGTPPRAGLPGSNSSGAQAQPAPIHGVPAALKPGAVVASDEVIMPSGRRTRRSVVTTSSPLGRLLVIEDRDDGRVVELYSAEHLVVSARNPETFDRIRSLLRAGGARVEAPFVDASFAFIQIEGNSPASIFDELRSASLLLGDTGVVELDGVGSGSAAPADPSYPTQWHHQTIGSEPGWEITQGSPSITVAVLDTGVNSLLAEFQYRTVSGYDYVNNDNDPSDDHGHGTAVAGVVAASANNGVLVAGVDWKCRVMPVKVLDASNFGYLSWWAAGVEFARGHGARVINLSAGSTGSSAALTSAIDNAIADKIIFVTVTHNDGRGTIRYPGNLAQAITVGATERNDTRSTFSNWGPAIDLVAPGNEIYTVSVNGSLAWWWGTSFAAPQVSGAAALLLSLNPDLDQNSVLALLAAGAEDQVGDAQDTVGFDSYYGWGRLNLNHSLILARTSPQITTRADGGARLRWTAPPNAATRQPYKLCWSEDMTTWNTVSSPSISFGTEAEWIDDGSETGSAPGLADRRFYRIAIETE